MDLGIKNKVVLIAGINNLEGMGAATAFGINVKGTLFMIREFVKRRGNYGVPT